MSSYPDPYPGDEIEVLIVKGRDKERDNKMSPIARFQEDGKTILFARNFHEQLGFGERWAVRIEKVHDGYIFAVPVQRLSEATLKAEVLAPDVARPVLDTLWKELEACEQVVRETQPVYEQLQTDVSVARKELQAAEKLLKTREDALDGVEEQLRTAQERVVAFKKALDKLAPQTVYMDQEAGQ